jgi:hypothetical protein
MARDRGISSRRPAPARPAPARPTPSGVPRAAARLAERAGPPAFTAPPLVRGVTRPLGAPGRMPALIRPGVPAPVAGVRTPQILTGARRALAAEEAAARQNVFQRPAQTPIGPVRVMPFGGVRGTGAQRARAIEALTNRPTRPTLVSYPGGGSLYGGTARRVPYPSLSPFPARFTPPMQLGPPAFGAPFPEPQYEPPYEPPVGGGGGEEGGPPMCEAPPGEPGFELPLDDYYGSTAFRFRPGG